MGFKGGSSHFDETLNLIGQHCNTCKTCLQKHFVEGRNSQFLKAKYTNNILDQKVLDHKSQGNKGINKNNSLGRSLGSKKFNDKDNC